MTGREPLRQIGKYPVLRKLGEGATSEVFLCQDPFRNRQVAVKRIFPEALRDAVRGRLFRLSSVSVAAARRRS